MLNEISDSIKFTIDSSVIVSYLLEDEELPAKAKSIWEEILTSKIKCIQASISLLEVAPAVKRRTDNDRLVRAIIEEINNTPNLTFIRLTKERLNSVVFTAVKFGLRSFDSIYVQIVNEFNTELVTFDKEIIQSLHLKDYLK